MKLEDLRPNTTLRGILTDSLVTVVNVQWFGSAALELTYKTPTGDLANELLYRHDEPRLDIVELQDGHYEKKDDTLNGARKLTNSLLPRRMMTQPGENLFGPGRLKLRASHYLNRLPREPHFSLVCTVRRVWMRGSNGSLRTGLISKRRHLLT